MNCPVTGKLPEPSLCNADTCARYFSCPHGCCGEDAYKILITLRKEADGWHSYHMLARDMPDAVYLPISRGVASAIDHLNDETKEAL